MRVEDEIHRAQDRPGFQSLPHVGCPALESAAESAAPAGPAPRTIAALSATGAEMRVDRRSLICAAGALAAPGWLHAQASAASTAEIAAREKAAPPLPAVGTPLSVPALDLLDGGRFEPDQARGRVLVLYWWASWCPFCALVTPHLAKLWRAERARGLSLLTLSIDRKAEDARAYLRQRGYDFPAALVTSEIDRALPKPKGLPITIVVGRRGTVVQAEAGQLFPEDVEALARHL